MNGFQSFFTGDALAARRDDAGNPDQVAGFDTGLPERFLERAQLLFVHADPLGQKVAGRNQFHD
nr:hypothetical protein [Flaviaesturariibacter flavus]